MTQVINDVIINYKSVGFDKVGMDVKQTSVALDGLVIASSSTEKATASLENRFNSLSRSLGTASAGAKKHAENVALANNVVAQGKVTQEQANEVIAASASKYNVASTGANGLANSSKLARHELINLGRQAQDVVVSLQGGQGFGTVLLQQGSQIADVFVSSGATVKGFTSQVGEWASKTFTATRLVAGGLAGVAAGVAYMGHEWSSAQKEIDRSLIGIGARTGTTVGDINKFASANATATGLSVDQARAAAVEFTKTGDIAVGKLKGLGEAVHGYSILTGKDATAATKDLAQALSGDLVAGAQKLSETYGFLSPAIEDSIRKLVNQGERAKAQQVIINAMAADNKRAEATVSDLAKAWEFLGNTYSRAKNALGAAITESPDEELTRLKGNQRRNPNALPSSARNRLASLETQGVDDRFSGFEKEQVRIASAADAVTKAVIPQIKAIQDLEAAYAALGRAQSADGTKDNGPAQQAIQNQIAALQESQAQAERYNQRVAEISKSWGDVGQSTALALQAAQNQLPVYEAVGGAAKMNAQYAADFNNAIDQGKTATEAAALAASNLSAAHAQVNSAAQETLASLRDQAAVAGAVTGAQQIQAQAQATFNSLIRQGVDASTASAVAAKEEANAREKATAQVLKQVHSLEQSTEMIKAQANGTEAATAAAQAYENAIRSGATAMAANALSAATLENYLTKAAVAAQKIEQADIQKANEAFGAQYNSAGALVGIGPAVGSPSTGGEPSNFNTNGRQGAFGLARSPSGGATYKGGSRGQDWYGSITQMLALQQVLGSQTVSSSDYVAKALAATGGSIDSAIAGLTAPGTRLTDSPMSQLSTLYNLKNSQTSSNADKIANDQAFLSWIQGQPQTIENLQAMQTLTDEIASLAKSTDSLNATNQDLLSPYYGQDPRSSHIGFRSQGMANTGYIDIPGVPSANDNHTLTLPVASGERVNVTNGPSRGNGSGSQVIQVTQHITIGAGGNKDEFGRTMYHAGQQLARQLRASSQ